MGDLSKVNYESMGVLAGIDTNNVIYTNGDTSTSSVSWTATQDCWMVASVSAANSGTTAYVSLDGKPIVVARGNSSGITIWGVFPVKVGQVIGSVTQSGNTYRVIAYGIKW